MTTGTRGNIFELIDGLDDAASVPDLVARLKPILNQMAYYSVTGEGAVMETQEEWHGEFRDRLYSATQSDYDAHKQRKSPAAAVEKKVKAEKKPYIPGAIGALKVKPRAPPTRPPPESLSPALMQIMNGTHPSLGKEDD